MYVLLNIYYVYKNWVLYCFLIIFLIKYLVSKMALEMNSSSHQYVDSSQWIESY